MTLSARNLVFSQSGKTILHNISLDVAPGTITGIIGPNGAGKSTLLSLLAGIRQPDSGTVLLDGQPLTGWSPAALARTRAWLPQNAQVNWPRTTQQVVGMGRMPFADSEAGMEKVVSETLVACGISHLRERQFDTLSAGEQALAHLARILAGQPSLMLLDEPAASLDPGHVLRVMEILARQRQQTGTTTVLVLHDLAVAARWCDRLVLLHQGKLAAGGEPENVLTEGNLLACYGVQTRLLRGEQGLIPDYLRRGDSDG